MKKYLVSPTRGNRDVRLVAIMKTPLEFYHREILGALRPLIKKGWTLEQMCIFLNSHSKYTFRRHPWKVASLSQTIKAALAAEEAAKNEK